MGNCWNSHLYSTETGKRLEMEWREQSTLSCEVAFAEAQRWVEVSEILVVSIQLMKRGTAHWLRNWISCVGAEMKPEIVQGRGSLRFH